MGNHGKTCDQIVQEALDGPIKAERLCEMARDKKRILLVTSDHTRPMPSGITLPLLLGEIRKYNKNPEIKILIATGCHRPTTREEMIDKFGQEIVDKEQILNHDSKDKANLTYKGLLPSGGELWLNSLVDWADLVVAEGFIEPHFFAGFSGGRKSILPGIASAETVLANHCSEFIADRYATTGNIYNNPINRDMVYGSQKGNLRFILNVALDTDKNIIGAFAGDPGKAHQIGCDFVNQLAQVNGVSAPIVLTSNGGYPLDQNIYQAVKGMTAAEACVEKGGAIVIAASCMDGHGGEDFYKWFADAPSPKDVMNKILSIPRDQTLPDQWQAQILARVLERASVILVTNMCPPEMIESMHMIHAKTLEEGIKKAESLTSPNAPITVIPDGVGVIIRRQKNEND